MRTIAQVLVVGGFAALSGCATVDPDAARERVAGLAAPRAGVGLDAATLSNAARAGERSRELIGTPLDVEAAIELALLNSSALQTRLAALDVADADRVQALRLANPAFSFSSKRNAETRSIERSVAINLLSLMAMPLAERLAQRQFAEAELATAAAAVDVAARARAAWINAVASQEALRYFEQVQAAAEAASELARRMQAAGNFSALERMREHAFAAEAAAQLARARQRALSDREALTRAMGLRPPASGYALPDRLPALPQGPRTPVDAEAVALAERLDLLAARRAAERDDEALELTRSTRLLSVLHAGYVNESDRGEPRKDGYEVEVELPLFDWGDAKLARAEAMQRLSRARLAGTEAAAVSEVREQLALYRSSFDLARHYQDEVVPLRKRISDEVLLRYNGMLVGVFELLADAREQVTSVVSALEAKREFWLADARLSHALAGGSPEGNAAAAPAMGAAPRAPSH